MLHNGFDSYLEYELYAFLESQVDSKNGEKILLGALFKSDKIFYYADFYLPEGCKALEIKPKTIIEAKSRLFPDTLYRLKRLFDEIKKAENFIVVYEDPGSFSTDLLKRFKEYEGSGFIVRSKVEFFGEKKTGVDSKDIRLSKQTTDDWTQEKERLLVDAQQHFYNSPHNTFFIGAGLGASVRMPAWEELLGGLLGYAKKVSNTAIGKEDYKVIGDSCNNSSLITGRYIENGFKDSEQFKQHIYKVLYKNNPKPDSDLYKAITKAISTEHVEQVITFNFDDLLETALEKKGISVHSIFDRRHYSGSRFPVYHVHGMVPQEKPIDSTPVLSEKEYHMLYRESFHWSNVIQLQAFSRTTCFFIGLSMNDPNLRRLLDISRNGIEKDADSQGERLCHYAFLERKPLNPEKPNTAKDEEHFALQEKMMAELGINVIWYEHGQYAEIPKMIERLCKKPK